MFRDSVEYCVAFSEHFTVKYCHTLQKPLRRSCLADVPAPHASGNFTKALRDGRRTLTGTAGRRKLTDLVIL